MTEAKLVRTIRGDFVKAESITEFVIQSVHDYNQYKKLQCSIQCNDKNSTKIEWQLNTQANDSLILKYGKQTDQWLSKTIPIKTRETDKGPSIEVDVLKLEATL